MFRRSAQLLPRRHASHGHKKVSPFLNDLAYTPNPKAGDSFKKAYEAKVKHSGPVTDTWKKISYFVAFPVIILTAIPIAKIEMDHAKHREHMRHLSDEEWPTQYPYQNIRSKKFFWLDGDKTLFWNSDINRHIES